MINQLKPLALRWTAVFLVTTILVFFSEKMYWYPQGYALLELILVYATPTAVCLMFITHFRATHLAQIVLVGALYGFLIEGGLTPVLFEGGLFEICTLFQMVTGAALFIWASVNCLWGKTAVSPQSTAV